MKYMKIILVVLLLVVFSACNFKSKKSHIDTVSLTRSEALEKWDKFSQLASEKRKELWKDDIEYMVRILRNNHKNIYHMISKEAFDEKAHMLLEEVDTLREVEIILRLKELVADIGDGHTKVNDIIPMSYFPITADKYKEGYIIVGTVDDYEEIIGTKLKKINGIEIDEILRRISSCISSDNKVDLESRGMRYLSYASYLNSAGIISEEEKSVFTFETLDGKEFEREIKSYTVDNRPYDWVNMVKKYPESSRSLRYKYYKKPYAYEYFKEDNMLFIQYNSCISSAEYTIGEFMEKVEGIIDQNNVEYVIFDMRNNGGGNSRLIEPLIDKIASNKKINREGHLYVGIGSETYSSAILNTLYFKKNTKALLIGGDTGGAPNHYGEVKTFNLPNSALSVSYSVKYFNMTDEYKETIVPDIYLDNSLTSLIKGEDELVTEVLERIES